MRIKKQLILPVVTSVFLACSGPKKTVVTNPTPLNFYQSLPDEKEKKTLYGFISKEQITTDTSFGWYASNLKYYKVDSTTVQRIRAKKDKIHLILFCGTWCHDSQQLLPKYFTTLEAAGFDNDRLTIIGVDRNKLTINHLSQTFNIVNVPTMIVMEDGKEAGRIVEYGATALVDKELGEIVARLP